MRSLLAVGVLAVCVVAYSLWPTDAVDVEVPSVGSTIADDAQDRPSAAGASDDPAHRTGARSIGDGELGGGESTLPSTAPTDGATGSLVVRVVRATDQEPVPLAFLEIVALDGRPSGSTRARQATDTDGAVRFDGLVAGRWGLRLDRVAGQRELSVSAGTETRLEWEVEDAADVLVRVVYRNAGVTSPIAGARVRSWPRSGWLEQAKSDPGFVIGETNGAGELLIPERLSPGQLGSVWFAAEHARFGESDAKLAAWLVEDEAIGEPLELELVLEPGRGVALEVRVVDVDGRPVPGANVIARPFDVPSAERVDGVLTLRHRAQTATTDDAGLAVVRPLLSGNHRLGITADGFVRHTEEIAIDDLFEHSIDVVLERGVTLAGIVRDSQTGLVLDGATVTVGGRANTPNAVLGAFGVEATTGADGRFELRGVPVAGSMPFEASFRGYETLSGSLATDGDPVEPIAIQLVPLPTLRGVVLDGAGGARVGFRILAYAESEGGAVARWAEAESDAEGRFAMPVSGDSSYALTLFEPDQSLPVRLSPSPSGVRPSTELLEIVVPDELLATAFAEGRLVRGGEPRHDDLRLVAFQAIEPPGGSTTEPSDGPGILPARLTVDRNHPLVDVDEQRFRLGPLPPGAYRMTFQGDEVEVSAEVLLRPGTTTRLGDVELPAPGTLSVAVELAPGCMPTDVRVQLSNQTDELNSRLELLDLETLRAEVRAAPGDYDIVVFGHGFRWLRFDDVRIESGRTVELAGVLRAAMRVELDLHLPDGEQRTELEIRDSLGVLALSWIYEQPPGGDRSERWVPFLDPGTYRVTAVSGDRVYETSFTVEAPEVGLRQPRQRFAVRPTR